MEIRKFNLLLGQYCALEGSLEILQKKFDETPTEELATSIAEVKKQQADVDREFTLLTSKQDQE